MLYVSNNLKKATDSEASAARQVDYPPVLATARELAPVDYSYAMTPGVSRSHCGAKSESGIRSNSCGKRKSLIVAASRPKIRTCHAQICGGPRQTIHPPRPSGRSAFWLGSSGACPGRISLINDANAACLPKSFAEGNVASGSPWHFHGRRNKNATKMSRRRPFPELFSLMWARHPPKTRGSIVPAPGSQSANACGCSMSAERDPLRSNDQATHEIRLRSVSGLGSASWTTSRARSQAATKRRFKATLMVANKSQPKASVLFTLICRE